VSRADHFDREDFGARYGAHEASSGTQATASSKKGWPIARGDVLRVGESVLADRNGKGRPHKGIDIFAAAGSEVLAACDGHVLRAVDGRQGQTIAQHRAGLFVDVGGRDSWVYRYLHLADARVEPGRSIKRGDVLGTVGAAFTSGLRETPHLHFEIRQGDFNHSKRDYGRPVDPLRWLSPLRA
jgi:murein DD-endopeptidase MepM/ murein hydrolase activator NlpD